MRLLVLTPEIKRASYRLRVHAVLERVAGLTVKTVELPRSGVALERVIDRAADFDATLLHKRLLERRSAIRLRSRARRLFYDVDDAVMSESPGGDSWWGRWKRARKFAATASVLDVAVAGNEHLAGLLRGAGVKRVVVVPTCVDPGEYAVKAHMKVSPVRLVWIGSRSTLPYLEAMVPALEAAHEHVPLELVVIADGAPASKVLPVRLEPWSLEGEKAALLLGDIGIAPTPDDPWTRGKCGFKLVQYMAAGLPSVASPIAANREIVRDGATGLWATTADEWTRAVVSLAVDVEARQRMGSAARRACEADYSLEEAARAWAAVLLGLDGGV